MDACDSTALMVTLHNTTNITCSVIIMWNNN